MKVYLVIFTVILCLFLLFVCFKVTNKLYEKYWYVRYYPIGQIDVNKSQINDVELICIGDSRCASWDLNPIGVSHINLGLNGATSKQVEIISLLNKNILKNKIILIQLGVNDLKLYQFNVIKEEELLMNFTKSYHTILSQLMSDSNVVICTAIFPVSEKEWYKGIFGNAQSLNRLVLKLNTGLENICKEYDSVLYFDSFTPLLSDKRVANKKFYQDRLHLTPKGYELLNKELIPFIEQYGKTKN